MARNTGADCRQCRREKCKLFLKGDRCYSEKCALTRRAKIPGVHADSRKKTTEYGLQLREKQKTKRIYGLQEKQFHKYYEEAERRRALPVPTCLCCWKKDLTTWCTAWVWAYPAVEGKTIRKPRTHHRQRKRVTIPSYRQSWRRCFRQGKQAGTTCIRGIEAIQEGCKPSQMVGLRPATLTGKVLAKPTREDIDMSIQEHMIVELYSK